MAFRYRLGLFWFVFAAAVAGAEPHAGKPPAAGANAPTAPPDYTDIVDRTDAQIRELKLSPSLVRRFKPPAPEASGFRVGQTNKTETIRKLTSINKVKIEKLEEAMRPGADSNAGFLGKEEKLLDVLAADNDFVLSKKTDHQEIGLHLRILGELGSAPNSSEFVYHGKRFKVTRADTRGYQDSPFQDDTRDGRNATVTNLDNGKKISFALLVPVMIERYGFYEGPKSPYRVDPKAILEVLDFLPMKKR